MGHGELSCPDHASVVATDLRCAFLVAFLSDHGEGGVGEGGIVYSEISEIPVILQHVFFNLFLAEESVVVGRTFAESEQQRRDIVDPQILVFFRKYLNKNILEQFCRILFIAGVHFFLELLEEHLEGCFKFACETGHHLPFNLLSEF